MKHILTILFLLITSSLFAQQKYVMKVQGTPGVYNMSKVGDSLIYYVAGVRYAVSVGSTVDLSNYYNKSQTDALIPTNVSQLANDAGYINSAAIAGKTNNSDTAAMLNPYLRKSDTTGKWISPSVAAATLAAKNNPILTGGKIIMDTTQLLYLPNQTDYRGSLIIGNGGSNLSIGTGKLNTFVGLDVGVKNTSGSGNTSVGYSSLTENTTGWGNVSLGSNALHWNTTGYDNAVLGNNAAFVNTSGYGNTAFGNSSLNKNTTGSKNTSLGYFSMFNAVGTLNTSIGANSMFGVSGNSAVTGNTSVGYNSGTNLITGADYNVLIGYGSGANITSGGYNLMIGFNAIAKNPTANYQLNIGNTITGNLSDKTISIASLKTNITPPSTSGTIKTVVADTSGLLSVRDVIPVIKSSVSSKKWVLFGDSFSESIYSGYTSAVISKINFTNTPKTNAHGGYVIRDVKYTIDSILTATPNYFDTCDIVSLLIGVNDFARGLGYPIGTYESSKYDTSYAGCLRYFIDTILQKNPAIQLYIMTPPEGNSLYVHYKSANTAGWSLKDLSNLIKRICADYAIPVIDLYNLSGFNQWTIPTLTVDGLHPNSVGSAILADIISDAFNGNRDNIVMPFGIASGNVMDAGRIIDSLAAANARIKSKLDTSYRDPVILKYPLQASLQNDTTVFSIPQTYLDSLLKTTDSLGIGGAALEAGVTAYSKDKTVHTVFGGDNGRSITTAANFEISANSIILNAISTNITPGYVLRYDVPDYGNVFDTYVTGSYNQVTEVNKGVIMRLDTMRHFTPTSLNKSYTQYNSGADSVTADIDAGNMIVILNQSTALKIKNPIGNPDNGQQLLFQISDDGTARAITWESDFGFDATDAPMPTSTTPTKYIYVDCIWNENSGKYFVLSVKTR